MDFSGGVIIFTMDFFQRNNQIYNGLFWRSCHIYNQLFSEGVYSSLDITLVLDIGGYSSIHIWASTGDFIAGNRFCLFDLILYVPVNKVSDMSGRNQH